MVAPACKTFCGDVAGGAGGAGVAGSAAKLSSAVDQAIPGGVATLVLLPVEDFDVGPALTADEANSRIVVNQSGVYALGHKMAWRGTTDLSVEGSSFFFLNGAPFDFGHTSFDLTEEQAYSNSDLLELEAGDFIQLFVQHNGTTPINVFGRLWMELVALT